MDGPRFDNHNPDVNNYLSTYQSNISDLGKMVAAIKTAFPDAPELSVITGEAGAQITTSPVDAIEEIKKYKALMDDGIISQQEFEAKKRQLLGI